MLYLVLKKQPAKEGSYKFIIEYTQTLKSKQEVFKVETDYIKMKDEKSSL
jgi:hypothetical protein